jgi:S-adenosylmethionine decarboxylase
MHVMLDGYVTKHDNILYDEDSLKGFMAVVAGMIGMTRWGDPVVRAYPKENGIVSGLSGVQFIVESSIVVHTYPELKFIYLDLFSCQDIKPDAVQRVIGHLGLRDFQRCVIPKRGHSHLIRSMADGSRR